MKIIQETYDLKLAVLVECKLKFFGFQKTWNYKELIEFSQESTILGKLQWSCGKLEPKLSKLGQF